MSINNPVRNNRSFLAAAEQRLIRWMLPRIPAYVSSLHLTGVGLFGSLLSSIGLVGCNFSQFWLTLVVLGIVLNWFGDSLDGSLARFRQEERPRFGFLVDHTCDLFSQVLTIVAFGLSPFLSLVSSLVILLCYLLFSAYTYIRAVTQYVHQMSYIGVGATEFRILMIFWSVLGAALGLHEPLVNGLSSIDISILGLALLAMCALVYKLIADAIAIARDERAAHAPSPTESELAAPEIEQSRARAAFR